MAGNIKGITIEFMGDTTKLDKALRDVRKSTKDIDSELRKVNQSLKFNPGNVDLLRQKQELLSQKIKKTETNLEELKKMQQQVAEDPSQGKNSAAYRELQREIIKSENQLKRFNAEQRKIKAALSPLGQFGTKMSEVGSKLTSAGQKMRTLSMYGAAVAASVGALAVKSGKAADDLNTLSKVTGIATDKLQLYKLAAEQVDVSVEAIAKSQKTLKKNMLSASEGGSVAETFKKLGINVKDSNGNLRDADEVWNEAIKKLGSMKNETERDALAMKLMGKSASELNPLIKDGGEAYQRVAEMMSKNGLKVVDQKTLDQANEFNDRISDIKTIAAATFQSIGTQLAAYLAPALQKVVDLVGKIAGWLSNLSPQVLAIVGGIGAILAVLAPLLLIAGAFASAIGSISSAMALFGVTISVALGPLALIVGAIAAVIAIGVLLYKNWDQIMARLNGLKNGMILVWNGIKASVVKQIQLIKSAVEHDFNAIKTVVVRVWNAVKNAIVNPIKTAYNTVKGIIQKIKGFFPISMGKLFDNIKLPKITVKGGKAPWGIGGKGQLPSFDVHWAAKGGIFDSPSIIGVGEAGPEAVIPIDKLQAMLDRSNSQLATALITAMRMGTLGAQTNQPIVIELGGVKVAEVIYKYNKMGQMVMEAK